MQAQSNRLSRCVYGILHVVIRNMMLMTFSHCVSAGFSFPSPKLIHGFSDFRSFFHALYFYFYVYVFISLGHPQF